MDSGAEFPDASALFERLFSSRNRDFPTFLSLLLALANPSNSSNREENPSTRDQETENNNRVTRERLILINPFTQSMIVIEGSGNNGGSGGFDSFIDELFSKGGQPPASKASMEAMPVVEVGEGDGECVICLEEWEACGFAREMPCKHRFHSGCIEKWLKIHGTCPVCRYKMPVEERDDGDRKEEEDGGARRRRGVLMRFSFGDGEGDQNDSAMESRDSSNASATGDSDMES